MVEEVAGVFRERRFEPLLLPLYGEPLGPPVGLIAEAFLPLSFIGDTLLTDEVGPQDQGGVRRAKL